jgi:hypothetical protein
MHQSVTDKSEIRKAKLLYESRGGLQASVLVFCTFSAGNRRAGRGLRRRKGIDGGWWTGETCILEERAPKSNRIFNANCIAA